MDFGLILRTVAGLGQSVVALRYHEDELIPRMRLAEQPTVVVQDASGDAVGLITAEEIIELVGCQV